MARTIDQQKRETLALEAFEILKREGTWNTSMSSLARALGIKRPTLYFYFPDMGALLNALLAYRLERLRRAVIDRMAPARHPIRALIALVEATDEIQRREKADMVALFELWAAVTGHGRQEALERENGFVESARAFLIAMVENGIARGTVAPCDAVGLVDLVLTCLDGLQTRRVLHSPGIETAKNFVVDSVLRPLIIQTKQEDMTP